MNDHALIPPAVPARRAWPRRRTWLIAVLAVLAVAAAALIGLALWADPNAHKARIEAGVSHALGMEVTIGGRVDLRWRPGAQLVLENVRARKQGTDIATVREAVIGVDARSLLSEQPQVHSVALHDAVIAVARNRDGRFNFQKDVPGEQPAPERSGPAVAFSGVTLTYTDPRWSQRVEARGCSGDVHDLLFAERPGPRGIASLSMRAQAACADVRVGGFVATDVNGSLEARRGVLQFAPLQGQLFGAPASSRVQADFTGAAPAYRIEQTVKQLPVESLLKALALKEVASGRVDLQAVLAMQGHSGAELQQTMKGKVSLRGRGLIYHGTDLDQQFERFESTQNFNLFDVGAVFLAGPVGLLVTKGYDFANVAQSAHGKSEVRALVSDWTIERGIARADDVAMATPANRVALKGGIDLVNDRYADMTIALLDTKGCAKVQQHVSGALAKPVVDKPNAIEALAGPAVRLLKKGTELLVGDQCEVFYAGALGAAK